MMKTLFLAAAAVALLTTAATADPFASAYGNTLTTTAPDNTKIVTYVNADGTWERHAADGTVMKGTFVWKDAQTACFTVTDPAPKPGEQASGCRPIKGTHAVGDTWTDTDPKGNVYTSTLSAGR
ncbi:MAG: hypothetical protein ABSC92_01985 [Rhizomicrobium sp.]